MKQYKIEKGNWAGYKDFATLQDCEAWVLDKFGEGYTVTEVGNAPIVSDAEKLEARQQFGKQLVNQYLLENDAIAKSWGRPFTVAEAGQQAQKLQLAMALLPNGSLKQVVDILSTTAPDTILTQDRINNYITQINEFLNPA
jgi:hypothetical protein